MKTFGEALDELLQDPPSAADMDAEIHRTEMRLLLLKTLRTNGKVDSSNGSTLKKPRKSTRPRKPKSMSPSPVKPTLTAHQIDEMAFKLGVHLKENGRCRRDALRNEFKIDDLALNKLLEMPWFEKDGTCWTLSSEGHAHFRRDD